MHKCPHCSKEFEVRIEVVEAQTTTDSDAILQNFVRTTERAAQAVPLTHSQQLDAVMECGSALGRTVDVNEAVAWKAAQAGEGGVCPHCTQHGDSSADMDALMRRPFALCPRHAALADKSRSVQKREAGDRCEFEGRWMSHAERDRLCAAREAIQRGEPMPTFAAMHCPCSDWPAAKGGHVGHHPDCKHAAPSREEPEP